MAIETFAWRIQAASQPTLKSKDKSGGFNLVMAMHRYPGTA